MIKVKFVIVFLFINFLSFAQTPKEYGKKIISLLASDDFAGRGYVENGLDKASNLIEEEFKKAGLTPIRQKVSYPINVVKNVDLKINGKSLIFGKDYLISANSPSLEGKFYPQEFNTNVVDSLFHYDDPKLLDKTFTELENKTDALIFPPKTFPENYVDGGTDANTYYRELSQGIVNNNVSDKFKVCVNFEKKLTHNISPKASKTAGITILNDVITEKIKTIDLKVDSHFEPNFESDNIYATIEGITKKDSLIFITAHYDHLGKINDAVFSGANDNASGVAMMLSIMNYFSKNKPDYTLVFCAFTGEEIGLIGSNFFVKNSPFNLKNIKVMLNFDMVGTGEEGIQVVNSKKYPKLFNSLLDINENHRLLKQIKYRGEACNSDHCPFDRKKVPAFFIYTLGGVSYYHDVLDKSETLSLKEFDDILTLFVKFIENL